MIQSSLRSLRSFAAISLCLLSACSTQQQAQISTWFNSPANQAVLKTVGAIVLNSAIACAQSAANQYVNTGTVDGKALEASAITGGLNGAAAQLRSLQATPEAASPKAVYQAFQFSGLSPATAAQVAPVVSTAIAGAVAQGVPPDRANEAAAIALDAAAKQAGQ
jgi:hypothetical protein